MGKLSSTFPTAESVDYALKRANKAEVDIGVLNWEMNNKIDYSDFRSGINNLQHQIDEIAQSHESGDVATEVAQARVGEDGSDYQTLKMRLDAESQDAKAIENEIASWSQNLFVANYTEMVNGYLATSTATTITPSSGYYTLKIRVKANTTYTITHQRHWGGFFDNDGRHLGSFGASGEDFYDYVVTTPDKTRYMWVVVPVSENLSEFMVVEGSSMPESFIKGEIKLRSYLKITQSSPLLNLSNNQKVLFDTETKVISIPQCSIIYGTSGKSFAMQTINLTQTTTENSSWALLYDYVNNIIIATNWKGDYEYPLIGVVYGNKIYLNGVLESQFVYYNNGVAINDVKSNVPLLNLSDSQYVNFDITNKTVTIPQSSILFNTNGRSFPSQTINLTQTTTENSSWALLYDYNNNAIIASFWKGTFNYPLIGVIYANKLYINGVLESQIRTYDDGELIPAHPIPSTPIINLTENQFIKYNFTDKTVDIPQCSILCGAVGKAFQARTIDLSQTETQNNCWALLYDYNNNDIIASFWKGTFDYPVIGVVYGKKIFINGALDSQLISVGQESIVHFFGDSITAGVHTTKAYHMYWAEWGNFKCKNYGIGTTGYKRTYSGSALAGNGVEGIGSTTTQTGDNTLLDVMQTVGSFSKCVLFAGTNDFGNSETATSFRTAVQNTLDYALSKTPFILVITPIMRTDYKTRVNNVGMKLSDYSDIIREECDNRGIACIDGMSVMLNPDNALYKSNFIPDGLHPNSTGHNMLARKLYNDFLAAMCK